MTAPTPGRSPADTTGDGRRRSTIAAYSPQQPRQEPEPGRVRAGRGMAGEGRFRRARSILFITISREIRMNHIAPLHEPLIREVPLSRLALAPENVRKTPADPVAEAEMKASIATHGLLENLVVRMDGPADAGAYAVIAGGRRLAAMKALAEDGTIDADHPVPCLVAADPAMAGELSLAENIVRIAMHPADQVIAFTKLADAGLSVGSIAARFGTAERLVEQRLRLGNVAPDLLDAYRADEIDLEVLKAFSVTPDHARQMAAWEQVVGQGYRPSAWQVKRLLTEERIPGTSAVARFVGVEAYEAAGGKVLRDLFSNDDDSAVWFDDPALLNNLATEKLRIFKDELETRWKWASAMVEVDWNTTARCGRIYPEPAERTPEEQAEIGKLEARQGVLAELDDDAWTEELVREAETIEERLDEIEGGIEARAVYRREDFGIAGCIATIAQDGTLQVIEGLVAPEDMPKETAAAPDGAGTSDGDDDDSHAAAAGIGTDAGRISVPAMSGPMQLPKDREAEARKEAGVGIGLADDLRSIRTALVKAKLAGDFEAAFDLMLFQLGRSVFTDGYKSHALDIAVRETADRPTMRMNDEDFAAWSPGEAMLEDRSGLSFDWLAIEDDGESFAAMRALSQAEKQALFAACVARTVKGQLAFEPLARPELEVTVARLDIDFASHVRPTADMLWSRINKGRILDIARSVLSPAWASDRSKNKKPDLAKAMEEAFAAGDPPLGLHADDHAAALAWLPPGFAAFDTGHVEDEPEDAAAAEPAAEASGPDPEPVAGPAADAESPETPADPPRTNSVVESVEAPAVAERRAAERATGNGNGSGNDHATPAAPETDSAAGDHGSDAGVDGPESGAAEPAKPADIAARHPGPVIGHDAGDGLDIPEFLCRVPGHSAVN